MDGMDEQTISFLKAGASLIIVLCLMLGLAGAFRYFTGQAALPLQALKKRLSIKEIKSIDHRHKLVIVGRDEAEHLILISGTNAPIVLETNLPPRPQNHEKDDKNNDEKSKEITGDKLDA
jgi:flagellar biogenesis protein FliO